MTRFAKIDTATSVVVNVEEWGQEPAQAGFIYVASETANRDDVWDGEAFSTPSADLATVKAAALAALADRRWRATQTFDYDGESAVPADPALSVITSIAVVEQIAPSGGAARTFKLKAGVFRSWTVAQIITYGMAIGVHVQACFDLEADLAGQIVAAVTSQAVAAIDIDTGWPT